MPDPEAGPPSQAQGLLYCLGLFGAVMVLFALAFTVSAVKERSRVQASERWPSVPGKVVRSSLGCRPNPGSS